MKHQAFEQVERLIKKRHTTKAHAMNGKIIPDNQIQKLLALADRAPNHGQTEPWRFVVLSDEALNDFGKAHADIYWANTEQAKRRKSKYNKYIRYTENASHIIATFMRPGTNAKIPEKEERSAVSAAIQNMLLAGTALGIASFWSTGGMTYHPQLKKYLGLREGDKMIGMLYLGYSDNPRQGKKRSIPLEDKVVWLKETMIDPASA